MVDIQSTAAEIRRRIKKRRKKKKIEIKGQKYNGLPYYLGICKWLFALYVQ